MRPIPRLVEGLRSIVRQRGLSYGKIAVRLSVSESTVKRMFSRGVMPVGRLEETCRLLDIDFFDLAKAASRRQSNDFVFSAHQQRELASDPILLAVLHLLMNDWTAERIASSYAITKPQMAGLLAKLDRLGLIDLKPRNLVKLRVSPHLSWSRQSAVRSRYESMVRREFLSSRFDGTDAIFRFEVRELSRAGISALQRKIEHLAGEMQELADRDLACPPEDKMSVGCLFAARPWVFSVLASLRRRSVTAPRK